MDLNAFRGLHPALYAAYDDQGEISAPRVRALAGYFADLGMKGLFINGTSGEAPLLTCEERRQVVEAVVPGLRDRLTMMVHVGTASTREAVELARHAEAHGAHAIAAVPSIYFRLDEESVLAHWQQIAAATSLPFIVYNIPQYTGFSVTPGLLRRMMQMAFVIGVKNSSADVLDIARFRAAGGDQLVIFNGPDEQYLAGRMMGAEAGIGGTYGAMPELYLKLESLIREGRLEEAGQLQRQIISIIDQLLGFPSLFAACKGLLRLRGIELGPVRSPLRPLRPEDQPALSALQSQISGLTAKWC